MSETMTGQNPSEQRVFGDAFSFSRGVSDEDVRKGYFVERIAAIREGKTTWLSRALDGESGVAADLFREGEVVASLDYDYETRRASIYVTSEGGVFGDTTLCDQLIFDNAVAAAEQYAAGTEVEPTPSP